MSNLSKNKNLSKKMQKVTVGADDSDYSTLMSSQKIRNVKAI